MVSKADFTADEWRLLVSSPMLASLAVTLAEPSGLWGMMKEAMTSGLALMAAKNDATADPLARAIAADIETTDGRSAVRDGLKAELSGSSPPEMKQKVLSALGEVGRILAAKDPAGASAFKVWLQGVAQKTAEAASEGGFLGFGGVQVTDAEKATLAEIATALG